MHTLPFWRPARPSPSAPLACLVRLSVRQPRRHRRCVSTNTPAAPSAPHEPLRILFCGSDDFSCATLRALHAEMVCQRQQPADDGPGLRPGHRPGLRDDADADDNVGRIAALEVVVRPPKRTGRGLTTVKESPVQQLATALGLRVHVRDTFTGLTPPLVDVDVAPAAAAAAAAPTTTTSPFNLIVAVSFGLFVPARLLRAARYGGLNVHPSLLPDLAGAAPIEHALLAGRTRTGVTVQTLDAQTFDGGRVLLQGPAGAADGDRDGEKDDDVWAQSQATTPTEASKLSSASSSSPSSSSSSSSSSPPPLPGLPIPPGCTAAALRRRLAPLGADLLLAVLRRGLYLPEASLPPPLAIPATHNHHLHPLAPQRAPKLTKADRQVPWRAVSGASTAAAIDRRARALGPLWTHLVRRGAAVTTVTAATATATIPLTAATKRVILEDVDLVAVDDDDPTVAAAVAALRAVGPHGAPGVEGATSASTAPCPLRTLTFWQTVPSADAAATCATAQYRITLPFVVDGGTRLVVPVGVPAQARARAQAPRLGNNSDTTGAADGAYCLRIGTVKVEGDRAKPAAQAIEAFASHGTPLRDVSWDVVFSQ
ncbi:methionyl-tRNA formyltransferase family [Niveomyces insectorum RCEF 264]|uniref:Methionyl-tRNA formyltransferase family n=1 Tax=Niveomyces insectorum RCEF 264 TaxID=1081102 RepID=A0A167VF41_9HYPO|nr:methionyl-tRNA formyltransferase family [Niveomyces insectorum RCEF 264]